MFLESYCLNKIGFILEYLIGGATRIDLYKQGDYSLYNESIALGAEKDLAIDKIGLQPHSALATLDEVVVGLVLVGQRLLFTTKVYEQLITVESIIKIVEFQDYFILYIFYSSHYFSLYITVRTVCPTAFNVPASIQSISSFIVWWWGPKPLGLSGS